MPLRIAQDPTGWRIVPLAGVTDNDSGDFPVQILRFQAVDFPLRIPAQNMAAQRARSSGSGLKQLLDLPFFQDLPLLGIFRFRGLYPAKRIPPLFMGFPVFLKGHADKPDEDFVGSGPGDFTAAMVLFLFLQAHAVHKGEDISLLNLCHFEITEWITFYIPGVLTPVQFDCIDGIGGTFPHNPGAAGVIIKCGEFDQPIPGGYFIGVDMGRCPGGELIFQEGDEDEGGAVSGAFGGGIS
jgi:hypothetical protein